MLFWLCKGKVALLRCANYRMWKFFYEIISYSYLIIYSIKHSLIRNQIHMKFYTTTDLQRNSASITKEKTPSYIIRRWKPEWILLPFFTECDDFIEEYMEAYEMHKNREFLQEALKKSEASGIASFTI